MLCVMIHILSWTTKNLQKTLSMPLNSKLKKIQELFKDLHRNLRTFQGKWNSRTFQGPLLKFKDFSRLCKPWISLLYKILPTNLPVSKPTFYTFYTSHLRWNNTIYYSSYRPRTECSISKFFKKYCTQSIFKTISRGLLAKLIKNFQNHLYGRAVVTFDERQICSEH